MLELVSQATVLQLGDGQASPPALRLNRRVEAEAADGCAQGAGGKLGAGRYLALVFDFSTLLFGVASAVIVSCFEVVKDSKTTKVEIAQRYVMQYFA